MHPQNMPCKSASLPVTFGLRLLSCFPCPVIASILNCPVAQPCWCRSALLYLTASDSSLRHALLQVMEMVGLDTEWMLNDLLACADAVYA